MHDDILAIDPAFAELLERAGALARTAARDSRFVEQIRAARLAAASRTLAAALDAPRPEAVPFTYAPGLRRRWLFIDNRWRYEALRHIYHHPDGTWIYAQLAEHRAYTARHLADE